jgi:hypothetical protein
MRHTLLHECGLVCADIASSYDNMCAVYQVEYWHGTMPLDHRTYADHLQEFDVPEQLRQEGAFVPDSVPMGPCFLQLVVGMPASTNALDMVRNFDLQCCKTHFDGANIHIPSPDETLGYVTICARPQRDLTEAFVCALTTLEPNLSLMTRRRELNIRCALAVVPPGLWEAAGFTPYGPAEQARRRREVMRLGDIQHAYRTGEMKPWGCCIEWIQGWDERYCYVKKYVTAADGCSHIDCSA